MYSLYEVWHCDCVWYVFLCTYVMFVRLMNCERKNWKVVKVAINSKLHYMYTKPEINLQPHIKQISLFSILVNEGTSYPQSVHGF